MHINTLEKKIGGRGAATYPEFRNLILTLCLCAWDHSPWQGYAGDQTRVGHKQSKALTHCIISWAPPLEGLDWTTNRIAIIKKQSGNVALVGGRRDIHSRSDF